MNEYYSEDPIYYSYKDLRSVSMIKTIAIVLLCLLSGLFYWQIRDLQTRVRQLEYRILFMQEDDKSLEEHDAIQDQKIRVLQTDVDILVKIQKGIDPYIQ